MTIVGIVGAGTFGYKLAVLFRCSGLEVIVGSRSAQRGQEIARSLGCRGGSQQYCIDNSDIVFAVIPYIAEDGCDNMIKFLDTHRSILSGKCVVDLSNVFYRTLPSDFDASKYSSGLQYHIDYVNDPSISFAAGYKVIMNTSLLTTKQGVEICGHDRAKNVLKSVIESTGWWALDRGGVEAAPLLEPKGPNRERIDDPRGIERLQNMVGVEYFE